LRRLLLLINGKLRQRTDDPRNRERRGERAKVEKRRQIGRRVPRNAKTPKALANGVLR
jgi:hypothetical protein